MKLAQLFSFYQSFKLGGDPLRDVRGIAIDSRLAHKDDVFVAIRGTHHDSHHNIPEVCKKGVVGIVIEDSTLVPNDFRGAILKVPNSRVALVRLASRFYGEPGEKLFIAGVTGTNGKTSVTYIIESILNEFGMSTGVLGTIDHHLGAKVWRSELTTPDPVTLQKRLSEFVVLGARAVAMEVSSHAIHQGRIDGLNFSAAVFTNLTRDHLDYHETMDNYFAAKERLFADLISRTRARVPYAIINADDEWAMKLRISDAAKTWTYGEAKSDFQFQILETGFGGTRFRLKCPRGTVEVKTNLIGRHNVYNCVAAMAVGVSAGASLEVCAMGVEKLMGIPGRLQKVPVQGPVHAYVDYAHTDDALRSVLTVLRSIRSQTAPNRKIITVFGCGGDRDKGKRPLMAKVATGLSDLSIITSDNPRTEDPMSIVQEILAGVPNDLLNSKVFVEIDRREAIRKAISMAGPKDVLLIAGKGNEKYQIIGSKSYEFDDLKIAGEFIRVE